MVVRKRKREEEEKREKQRAAEVEQQKQRLSVVLERVPDTIDWSSVAVKASRAEEPQEVWLRSQAEALLKELYAESSVENCIARLLNVEGGMIREAAKIASETTELENSPALEALLAYKDTMRISDDDWPITVRTFRLGKYATITQIRKLREEQNSKFGVRRTPGNNGAYVPVIPYLQKVLVQENLPNNEAIDLNFAFDNAKMSANGKVVISVCSYTILKLDIGRARSEYL